MWQRTVTCEDEIVKCEKKKRVRELSNVTIKLSHDVGIAQYEDGTVKCGKKK